MLPRFHPAWLQFAARLDVYIIWLQDAFAAVAGLHRPGSLNVRLLLGLHRPGSLNVRLLLLIIA